MLTYQNDVTIKTMFQTRFAAHRELDQVAQGMGFNPETNHGCFIGCTMDEYNHESFAKHIGPQWLAHLADKIFEGLPKAEGPQFGTDLLEAIPVGKDIDAIKWPLAIARHERQLVLIAGNTEPYADECRKALQGVIDYCKAQFAGTAASAAWSAARSAARSAALSAAESAESAESAAWSAARSAARSAALSAAESAESAESAAESERSAERSAAWSAQSAWSAARSAESAESAAESAWWDEYKIERDTLLALLRNFK